MTRQEAERLITQEARLLELGFTRAEAEQLRRISMTLQRWFERECGDGNSYGSWAIERDDNGDGPPFLVHHHYRYREGKDIVIRTCIPDREAGARKRLAAIITARNEREQPIQHTAETCPGRPCSDVCDHVEQHDGITVRAYIQTDPRGAALYILRLGDVPAGKDDASYYTNGICVY